MDKQILSSCLLIFTLKMKHLDWTIWNHMSALIYLFIRSTVAIQKSFSNAIVTFRTFQTYYKNDNLLIAVKFVNLIFNDSYVVHLFIHLSGLFPDNRYLHKLILKLHVNFFYLSWFFNFWLILKVLIDKLLREFLSIFTCINVVFNIFLEDTFVSLLENLSSCVKLKK